MPAQDLTIAPTLVQAAAGVDETLQDVELGEGFSEIAGLFPALHEVKAIREPAEIPSQGTIQRIYGKKLVDANPLQRVYAIAQAYNGFGQYGYYVQTDQKIYFHQCESPKDLHINFATLQSLGTDENNNSLNIFGHQESTNQLPPDTSISCVFDYPSVDKPPINDIGHAGVDFVIIKVTPASTADNRLRTRLQSLNAGIAYDGIDTGFYITQNACVQDSVPLVTGLDGLYWLPPTNVKLAYLGWGGNALVNVWTQSLATPKPNIWTQIAAPTKTNQYPDNYIYSTLGGSPPAPVGGIVMLGGLIVGKRYFFSGSLGVWYCYQQVGSNFYIRFEFNVTYNTQSPSASQGQTAISGNIIYTRDAGAWVKPYFLSWNPDWTWANATARLAQATASGDLNKRGHQTDTDTWWQLTQVAVTVSYSWAYTSAATRQTATGFISSDIGKLSHQIDNDTYWTLVDFNRHATKTDQSEYYLINLNRLFTDFQSISPASIQFLLRGYWDHARGGAGNINIVATSFKGGLLVRTDKIVWGVSGGTQKATISSTKNTTLLVSDADAKGKNLAIITVTMSDGSLNITDPSSNSDGATLCPF